MLRSASINASQSRSLFLLRQINSNKWFSIKFLLRLLGAICCLIPFHNPSMVFVWTPVSGSVKCLEWFTVSWCTSSSSSMFRYPRQQSVRTIEPFLTWVFKNFFIVSLSRFSTFTRKHFFSDVFSIPPITYTPSTLLLLWYFHRPNFDSSTSTVIPSPPIIWS